MGRYTRIIIYRSLAAAIDLVIGVAYGGISAFYGGRVDNIMQRIMEIINGIPYLIIVILMVIIMGSGIWSITLAMAITGWIGMSRIVRGQILKLKPRICISISYIRCNKYTINCETFNSKRNGTYYRNDNVYNSISGVW